MSESEHSSAPPSGELTLLLRQFDPADAAAVKQLYTLVYTELRKLAAAKMARERPGHTLQPTALVHEAWLRLGGDRQPAWRNRAQFFAAAAEAMRRILIENVRRKRAARRGGGVEQTSLDADAFGIASPLPDEDLLALSEAMDQLSAHDPRKAEIIKQWYFVGLTLAEAAELMGISEATAQRDLVYAKAWLGREFQRLRD
jgi:RNA polymerase sigma factor (TIGR02999 family)